MHSPNRHSTTTFSQPFPQPSCNRFPTPHQPSGTSTRPQPTFNRHATASQSRPCRNRCPITFQPPEAARRTIPRLANTHDSTILRVESKNDTISTHPSYIHDSPTPTAIQSQFNLNHKARQRSFPRDTSRNESKALLQGAVSAARRPRKYRVAASRSLSCPRRAASIEGMTPLADASAASEANIEHRTC